MLYVWESIFSLCQGCLPDGIPWCEYEHRTAIREHNSTQICRRAPATVNLIHYISTNVFFLFFFLAQTLLVNGIQASIRYLVIVLEVSHKAFFFFLVLEGALGSRLKFTYICLLFCSKEWIFLEIFLSQPAQAGFWISGDLTAVEEEESSLPWAKSYDLGCLLCEWL